MNIAIVWAFIALKQFTLNYRELAEQIRELKETTSNHNVLLNQIYDAPLKAEKRLPGIGIIHFPIFAALSIVRHNYDF